MTIRQEKDDDKGKQCEDVNDISSRIIDFKKQPHNAPACSRKTHHVCKNEIIIKYSFPITSHHPRIFKSFNKPPSTLLPKFSTLLPNPYYSGPVSLSRSS